MTSLLAPDRVHTSITMAEPPFRCLIRRLRGAICVVCARCPPDARPPDAATMNTSKVAWQEPKFATGISPANTTISSSSGPSRTLLPCYLRARLNGTRQVPNVR